jgi:TDG/mug DNA glycosylase family protein
VAPPWPLLLPSEGTTTADAATASGSFSTRLGSPPTRLAPEDDVRLPSFGIGITDLVKDVAQSHDRGLDYSGTRMVAAHIEAAAPRWVAFNGATAGKAAARMLGHRTTDLGVQPWQIGASRVFVLPSSSGAHAAMPYAEKLRWWSELARLVKEA